MVKIYAKFNSKCSESGKVIKKGEQLLWDKSTKKVYSIDSKAYLEYQEHQARIAICDEDERVYNYSSGRGHS